MVGTSGVGVLRFILVQDARGGDIAADAKDLVVREDRGEEGEKQEEMEQDFHLFTQKARRLFSEMPGFELSS